MRRTRGRRLPPASTGGSADDRRLSGSGPRRPQATHAGAGEEAPTVPVCRPICRILSFRPRGETEVCSSARAPPLRQRLLPSLLPCRPQPCRQPLVWPERAWAIELSRCLLRSGVATIGPGSCAYLRMRGAGRGVSTLTLRALESGATENPGRIALGRRVPGSSSLQQTGHYPRSPAPNRVCRCDSRLPCAMPRYPAAPEIGEAR